MIVLDHNIYFDTTLRKLVFVRTYLPKGILKKIVSDFPNFGEKIFCFCSYIKIM